MSATSGVAEEVVSLPKGGGAVQGLGATFETDLNTGTGSYAIPIDVPAGPNGLCPHIAIRYHSAAGNGPFGLGWTMGLMAIARKTDGRIPDYGPQDDKFVLLGVEDLVAVGGNRYRPRVDTMHWRIERQPDGWQLIDTRGTRHRLGRTPQARVETVEDGLTKTAVWLPEAMEDTNGNAVRYFYRQEGAQRYPDRIEWGTYALRFSYESRPDRLSDGHYGFLLHTTLRCARIELHVTTLAPSLARSWALEYEQAPGAAHSLLRRVTLRGHAADGSVTQAPPLTLGYTDFRPRALERFEGVEPGVAPGTFTGQQELLDWDGDGLPDLLEMGGGRARVWRNLGRGRWGRPQSLPTLAAPIGLDEPGVAFADMEGNGTADLLMLNRPLAGYYPHLPGGGFANPVYWRQAPGARLTDGNARLVDLNGDGIIDLLVTGERFFSLYHRSPRDGWEARPRTIPRAQVPPVTFGDPRVLLADMNGDGLQDLVRVDGAGVTYWPYLGNGRWAAAVEMSNPPALPRRFDPARLFCRDIDGDGCADLVYVDFGRVVYWLNQGGLRFGDPHEIGYTPPAVVGEIRLADMRGTGTAGVLWSNVRTGTRGGGHFYLDFTGGVKPYLLTRIDNGLGLETLIRYRTSTEFALDDEEGGRPWRTFHPFPLQCVAELELRDAVTGTSSFTRHHYHDGRYDGQARTFLGFGMVEVEAVGDDAIPTLLTRNVYHLGLDPNDLERSLTNEERQRLGALRRRLLRTETYGLDGSAQQEQPYQVVQHEYTTQVEVIPSGATILIPVETRTLEEQREREATPFALREVTYLEFDEHGNILRQRLRVRRADAAATIDQDITTEARFAINGAAHIVSLPSRVTQRDAAGNALSVTVTHYDGLPHTGLPEGQVTSGNVTRRDTLALTDGLAAVIYGTAQPDWAALGYHRRPGEGGWWVTEASFERQDSPAGFTLVTRGPRGFETRLGYDDSRQYPKRLTDAAGNVLQGVVDERVFQMAAMNDANGHEVVDRFDALGRVIATIKPGDTTALPTSVFRYRTDLLPARTVTLQRERSGLPDTLDEYQYFNGRGEFIQRVVEGEGDAGRRFIVQEALQYTARGQVSARFLPYYVNDAGYAPPPLARPRLRIRYDALGRVVEQRKASGARITQSYGPGRVEARDEADNSAPTPTPVVHLLDGLKRVVSVEQHLSGRVVTARYEYDSLGRLTVVRDPDGGVSRLSYDLMGRVLIEETTATGRTVFVIDAAGNQMRRTTASGKSVRNTFDKLDRLIDVREEGAATPETVYTYLDVGDPAPPDGVRNRMGRLWRIEDRLGTLSHAYDDLGRVVQTRRSVTALGGRELVNDYDYDALGRQTRLRLPEPEPGAGRRVVDYRYNARGLPAIAPGYVRAAEYDVQGHVTRLVYQNNVVNQLDYDSDTGRPLRLRVTGADGSALRDQTFRYDAVGNLRRIDSPLPVESGQFTYDEMYRLTGATYGSGEQFAYSYSDGGNITGVAGLGTLTYGGAPGRGAVTAAGGGNYVYDMDGHLSTAPYGNLHFDGLDNLVRVDLSDGRHLDCVYDHQGQRVLKRVSGGPEVIWADAHLEYHDGKPVLWITFGRKRILALSNAQSLFLHADLQGTPTLYTGADGKEVRRLAFGPYGTLRFDSAANSGPPDAVQFTGQPFDAEMGLICLGRRFYDPHLGRFISPDRAVGGVYRSDAWNRYAYGHNSPLRYTDPTGRFSLGDFFAALAVGTVVAGLIVAGLCTGGATWALAGMVIHVSGLLFATAAGVAAGALIGGISAGVAGGDISAGILFGGFVGGVAAFSGGFLGALAGGAVGSLFTSQVGIYLAGGVGGAVQGAIIGAGTGAAIGFAGGKGTVESIWTHVWKGAAMGAITGAALGLATAYLMTTPNPTLRVGTLDKLNPNTPAAGGLGDKVSYLDASSGFGQSSARLATGLGGAGPVGSFISMGSGSALLNIPLGWVPLAMGQYGGMVFGTSLVIGVDKFTTFDFDDMLVIGLELPGYFVGIFMTFADDANWDWFEDMKSGLHDAFSLPETA